jgi:hypothetical protein
MLRLNQMLLAVAVAIAFSPLFAVLLYAGESSPP